MTDTLCFYSLIIRFPNYVFSLVSVRFSRHSGTRSSALCQRLCSKHANIIPKRTQQVRSVDINSFKHEWFGNWKWLIINNWCNIHGVRGKDINSNIRCSNVGRKGIGRKVFFNYYYVYCRGWPLTLTLGTVNLRSEPNCYEINGLQNTFFFYKKWKKHIVSTLHITLINTFLKSVSYFYFWFWESHVNREYCYGHHWYIIYFYTSSLIGDSN